MSFFSRVIPFTPDSTRHVRLTSSISKMRSNPPMSRTRSPRIGPRAPHTPLPPPSGVTLAALAVAQRKIAATCSRPDGRTTSTRSGVWPARSAMVAAGHRSRTGRSSTAAAPTIFSTSGLIGSASEARGEPPGQPARQDWHPESARPRVVVTAQHRARREQVLERCAAGFIKRAQALIGRKPGAKLLRRLQIVHVLKTGAQCRNRLAVVKDAKVQQRLRCGAVLAQAAADVVACCEHKRGGAKCLLTGFRRNDPRPIHLHTIHLCTHRAQADRLLQAPSVGRRR